VCLGLLLYSGQSESNGDFISFGMRDSKAEFRFDVGSGPTIITSDTITLNTWHTARIRREGQDGEYIN